MTVWIGWVQASDVARLHGIVPHAQQDERRLELVCDALNKTCIDMRPDLPIPTVDDSTAVGPFPGGVFSPAFDGRTGATYTDWNPRITMGLLKLAHAWYTGLGTGSIPDQYEGFNGPPPFMTRDIEQLLEIGRGFRPVVA